MSTQPSSTVVGDRTAVAVSAANGSERNPNRAARPQGRRYPPAPAELLASPAARRAMTERDVAAIYHLLQRYGVSQRRIASLTGQSQSEVSEILAGREVQSVRVLEAIADGLGTPRSWWRLTGEIGTRIDAVQAEVSAQLLRDQLTTMQATVSAMLVALGWHQ